MAGLGSVPQFASLYVGDLHPDVTEAMLYEIFNSVGPVASIRVCRDSVSRRSLGYGYVNFHQVSDAERALDTLNYSTIKNRSCRIMWSQRDPSLRKSGAGNIYVKNLDKNIDNKALYDTFSLFGNILSCKVASDATGNSYGYGFVHYETEEAAKQAIERVNGMQIGEKTVQVYEFKKRSERDTSNYTNLYVKGFPPDWNDEKLMEIFKEFGPVAATAIRTDNKGRIYGFVDFEKSEDAKKAVDGLHKKDMRTPEQKEEDEKSGRDKETAADGHPVHLFYCQRAQTKQERQAELRAKFGPPTTDQKQGVNLYVKNLDEGFDDDQLRELFQPFGNITSVATPKDDRGKCKGFGFVCFASPDEATKAVTEMHLKVIKGKPLYVGLAEKREARQERLRQRYTAPMGKGGSKGGGGGGAGPGGFGGKGGMGGMIPPLGPQPGMPPMGMMGPRGPMMFPQMMFPQMMGKGMMMPRGPMMGSPQMLAMMGKGPLGMGIGGKGLPGMPPLAGMGAMRPPGAGALGAGAVAAARPTLPQAGGIGVGPPLNAATLAAAPPAVQKQMIGEKLFPAISKIQPELAGKITGMMLEMDNSELLILLESEQQLRLKVDEALRVLQSAKAPM